MIEIIIDRFLNSEYAVGGTLAMLSGLSIRIMLTLVRQKWASTYHHTMSYILLPLITLTITTVIAGNIALSLGMIGALSIVRFRNPVKNPFELVMFFALITIGISMSVALRFGVGLTVAINAIIFLAYIFELLGQKIGFQTYSLLFARQNISTTKFPDCDNAMSFRKEEKINIHKSKLFHLLDWIDKNDGGVLFEPRIVSSTYFDNDVMGMFRDSEEGCVPRKKVRIRNYTKSDHTQDDSILETKISSVEGRYKTTTKLFSLTKILNTPKYIIRTK